MRLTLCKLRKFTLTLSWQKFRESDGFAKEITNQLIWRIFFQWEDNFHFSTLCICVRLPPAVWKFQNFSLVRFYVKSIFRVLEFQKLISCKIRIEKNPGISNLIIYLLQMLCVSSASAFLPATIHASNLHVIHLGHNPQGANETPLASNLHIALPILDMIHKTPTKRRVPCWWDMYFILLQFVLRNWHEISAFSCKNYGHKREICM